MSVITKNDSFIEWCNTTWNPTTGCSKVAKCADCMNCYAELVALKNKAAGYASYKDGFKPTMHDYRLTQPFSYDEPKIVFVNSMSDIFHEDFPLEYIQKVFFTMNACPEHQFLVLTKRTKRALDLSSQLLWTDNIWMGTSVGTNSRVPQIEILKHIPAKVKFVSFEPLLSKLNGLDLYGIDWAIIGGESPGLSGKMRASSLGDFFALVDDCDKSGTAVFVKQMGGILGSKMGMTKWGKADNKGGDFTKFPLKLQRREFPIDMSNYSI
jgi:protein gp37